ncbi:MAG: LytTR family DNA-binding domain-containing protein, partial [Bacteroidota bacterium]
LQHFKSPSFQVVFITAFNQFAQTAIRFGALDYLTKPVDPLELKAALLKAQVKQLEIQVAQLEIMRDTLSKVVEKKLPLRMSISTNKGVLYFDPANIIRLEAMQNFTEIKVEHDNRRLIASLIIRRFEEDLKPYRQFMRVQRSHMVNLHKVVRLARGDQFGLEMIDGKLVPIGKRYREDVVRRLEEYQV